MKKILLLLFIGITVLLSSCSSMEEEPAEEYDIINGFLTYDWDTMSYTNTSTYSIMYETGNIVADFLLIHDKALLNEELSLSKETAYIQLLLIIDEIATKSNTDHSDIINYSSADFKANCDAYSITITTTDIVTFNSFKDTVLDIESSSNRNSISVIDYIEYRLGESLTSEEILSLDLLQSSYYELTRNFGFFDINTHLLDALLVEFKDQIGFDPTPEELLQLEEAYNIIINLHND